MTELSGIQIRAFTESDIPGALELWSNVEGLGLTEFGTFGFQRGSTRAQQQIRRRCAVWVPTEERGCCCSCLCQKAGRAYGRLRPLGYDAGARRIRISTTSTMAANCPEQ
jgi:hypothetical protein